MLTDPLMLSLSGTWKLYQSFGDDMPCTKSPYWDVSVPGEVHQQLLDAEVCPDPFVECQFIDQIPWESRHYWYATEFDQPFEVCRDIWLVFQGVDAICEVYLNDTKIGRFDGMFGGPELDITPYLKDKNHLLVHILPAETDPETALTLYKNKIPYDGDLERSHRHLKLTQLMGGNGFPQRVVTAGIWLPVQLVHRPPHSLKDLWVQTLDIQPGKAILRAYVEGSVPDGEDVQLEHQLWGPQGKILSGENNVHFQSEKATFDFSLEDPELWWPNGYGSQPLYYLKVKISSNANPIIRRFGVRKIRWVDNPGTDKKLTIEVNGKEIYACGANWPSGDRTLRFDQDRCNWLLTLAQKANVCLLRYWCGLARDPLTFYDRCDELGILIIHDFPLDNSVNDYDTEKYIDRSIYRHQVRKIVRDLRGYASVIAWFSGNELRGGEIVGTSLYELVREPEAILQEEDADTERPWWPSSYLLNAGFTDEYEHYGRRRTQVQQLAIALETEPKFSIEMNQGAHHGMHVHSLRQIRRFLPKAIETWPPPSHIHLHKINGNYLNQAFMPGALPVLTDPVTAAPYSSWKEMSYYSDVYCGFAVEALLGNYRGRKPYNSGACPWCWSDQHPMLGHGAVDYYGAPKSLYYSMKRAYSPLRAVMNYSRPERDVRERLRGWIRIINETEIMFENYEIHIRFFDHDLREVVHIDSEKTQMASGKGCLGSDDIPKILDVCSAKDPIPSGSVFEVFDLNGLGYLFPLHTIFGWSDCSEDGGYSQPLAQTFFSVLVTLRNVDSEINNHTYYPFNFSWYESPANQLITRTNIDVRFDGWHKPGHGKLTVKNTGARLSPWVIVEINELELDQYVLSDNYIALLPEEQRHLDILLRPGIEMPSNVSFDVRGFNLENNIVEK